MDVYRAIADPTRRAILGELVDRSGQSLFALLRTPGHEARHQLLTAGDHAAPGRLEAAGLIRTRREGRSKLHWFVGGPLKAIVERWPISTDEGANER